MIDKVEDETIDKETLIAYWFPLHSHNYSWTWKGNTNKTLNKNFLDKLNTQLIYNLASWMIFIEISL